MTRILSLEVLLNRHTEQERHCTNKYTLTKYMFDFKLQVHVCMLARC